MPILGYERHRHRKFLADAFSQISNVEVHDAGDLDFQSYVDPMEWRSWNGSESKASEGSDERRSGSVHESSRLDPSEKKSFSRANAQSKVHREALLLDGYLNSEQVKPVHCRRTLDQFSYYMLKSTEVRDKGQVTYRWAKKGEWPPAPKDRPIVMIDQLWLWVLHDGTVITSSPSTWDEKEDFNLSNVIIKELMENKYRPVLKSAEDLLHLVLKTSVDFFRRKGPADCQFHDSFQSSINEVSEKQNTLFKAFRHTTKDLNDSNLDPKERKKAIDALFSLGQETELLVEILDIQDELTIVKNVLTQQQDVLSKLLNLYPKKAEEDADEEEGTHLPTGLGKSELLILKSLAQLLGDQAARGQGPLPANGGLQAALRGGDALLGVGDGDRVPKDELQPLQSGRAQARPRSKEREKEGEHHNPPPSIKARPLQNRNLMYETIGIVENNLRIVKDMLAYAAKVESSVCSYFLAFYPWSGL